MATRRTSETTKKEANTSKEVELSTNTDFDIDTDTEMDVVEIEKKVKEDSKQEMSKRTAKREDIPYDGPINCLRNEVVRVRHIPREGSITNPKHLLYGGMAERAIRTFVVPRLTSGMLVNVLTDNEKAYLEDIMGLEYNALSIYKKEDNFWSTSNPSGISSVKLSKQDNYFNLADPEDYIRYKILLANKDLIAPSLEALQDNPKATYQFVIISDGEELKSEVENMSSTMLCYKNFGKIETDIDKLRVIVETIEGRPTSKDVKLPFLQSRINNLIQADSKTFLAVITDSLLDTKVLIKRSVEAGTILRRGDFHYLASTGEPMCEKNEDPTFNVAARYLNQPKHQDIKFLLEGKLNND